MAASFKRLSDGVYLRPAGSEGPCEVSLNAVLPGDCVERRRITVDDLNVTVTATCTMVSGDWNALMRMGVEAQLERLSEIEDLLAGDLSGQDERHRVTLLLAQFADYDEGDTLEVLPTKLSAAQAFARRVIPGSRLGLRRKPHAVLLDPPRDETRLTALEREARWLEPVIPVVRADPEAVALHKVTAKMMTALVQSDLADLVKWV
ncbi:hypothetical protein EEDFHM_02106 [Methylorubrum populi]